MLLSRPLVCWFFTSEVILPIVLIHSNGRYEVKPVSTELVACLHSAEGLPDCGDGLDVRGLASQAGSLHS